MESKKIKILAIDDNKDNLVSLKALIKDRFPEALTLTALNGVKGIELAAKENPDVILLDIVMPDMDGYEVCQKLKVDDLLSDIPVVFVTAIKGDKESRIRALKCGAEGFLAKPIDESELIAQIRAMVKIRNVNIFKHKEKEQLAELVEERTHELNRTQEETVRLLDEVKSENEERKKVEIDLTESNQFNSQIINSAQEGIIVYDLNIKYQVWNPFMENFTGLPASEVIGKHPLDVFPFLKDAGVIGIIEKALKGEHHNGVDLPFRISTSGKTGWASDTTAPLYNSKNEIIGAISTVRDITERRLVDDALKKSEAKHSSMISNISDVIGIIGADGLMKYKSSNIEKWFGWKPQDLIGTNGFSNVHPDDLERIQKGFFTVLEKEDSSITFEFRYKCKDGSYKPIELTAKNLSNDPIINGVLLNYHDITERKMSELEIVQSEEKFKSLMQQSPFVVELYDIEGLQISVNKAYEELWGFPAETTVNEFNVLKSQEVVKSGLIKYIKRAYKGESVDVPEYHYNPTGETEAKGKGRVRWLSTRIYPIKDVSEKVKNIVIVHLDITERKQAEMDLKEKEESLNTAQKIAKIGSWEMDTNTKKLSWSKEMFDILEVGTDQEPTFELYYSRVHPDDLAFVQESGKSVLSDNEAIRAEYRLLTPSKKIKYVATEGQQHLDNKNNLIKLNGIVQDITERKLSEEKLQKNQHLLSKAQELGLIGTWELDIQKNSLKWTDENYKIFGVPLGTELTYDLFLNCIHPDDRDFVNEKWSAGLRNEPYDIEHRLIVDDKVKWVREKADIEFDSEGKPIRAIGFAQDITERKHSEYELKLNMKRIDALLELNQMTNSSLNDIYDYSLQKAVEITDSKIGFWGFVNEDKSKVNIFNWSGTAMKECQVENYGFEFDIEKSGIWGEVVRTGKPLIINDYSAPNPMKKGTPIGHIKLVNYLSIPLFLDNRMVAIVAVANKDQNYGESDLKQLTLLLNGMLKFSQEQNSKKELLIAKEKAEESDRLKSAFLANMSHEIRTPMNGILGFTNLLSTKDLTSEKQQYFIEIIQKSGNRMLDTINDIVDISKIEAGLMNASITESDINGQIESLHKFFKPEVESKGIQFIVNNGLTSKEAIIKTDHEKIYGILTNLIKNAIKFTTEGTIEFGYVLKSDSEPTELEFFVKDTGVGIPKDRQDAIFERFIQADIEDKQAFQGSGLGLTISKSYVEMLGGEIWIESQEGLGTTFYFTIPYNAVLEEKSVSNNIVPNDDKEGELKNMKILVAEDDEISDLLISETIQGISSEVIHATTGVEAIRLCYNNPDIDLVLMDIKMPEMGGYEATAKIRQFNKDVVIIAQTAHGLSGDREKAIEAGCTDYISKPIDTTKLFELIKSILINND